MVVIKIKRTANSQGFIESTNAAPIKIGNVRDSEKSFFIFSGVCFEDLFIIDFFCASKYEIICLSPIKHCHFE
jgi:hypothetical protein